jgi:hypothetical protein
MNFGNLFESLSGGPVHEVPGWVQVVVWPVVVLIFAFARPNNG